MKPYTPIYNRSSNKLIRFETSNYKDNNLNAVIKTVIYLDKNKPEQSIIAQVIWK